MSKVEVEKPVSITKCDYCDKEIDSESSDQWAHMIRSYVGSEESRHKRAKWLVFLWNKPNWGNNGRPDEIRYDFHAECFDKLMQELLERKSNG